MKTIKKIRLKENDTVLVLTGNDKGKQGRILEVNRENGKVTVENIWMATHHIKKSGGKRGETGIQKIPTPVDVSNLQLVCPRCNKPTKFIRVKVKSASIRKCKLCNEFIDKEKA
ncbi:MAG: 50S ribosomal protein L24 [bacterium]